MLGGSVAWFLSVFVVAICVGLVAVVLSKRSARSSAGDSEGKDVPSKLTTGRMGLSVSIIALVIAIYLLPVGIYLPENIGLPVFLYSLLAFPGFVIWGGILSFVSYRSERHRSGLAGMIIGGLSVVWLVASYFVRMLAFD